MATELSVLVVQLQAPQVAQRRAAADELMRFGEDAQAAACPLIAATGDEDEQVREAAVGALEELGPPLPSDRPQITSLLEDPCEDVGYWAATLLGRLGAAAEPSVPDLARVLARAGGDAVRQRAAWALGQIGPAARAARSELEAAADGDDVRLARLAKRALTAIGE